MVGDLKYSIHTFDHYGWLICDGRALSKIEYSELFELIGIKYGEPTPDTFKLPDLRGRVIGNIGQGNGLTNRSSGTLIGSETHTLTINEMPTHNHDIIDPGHTHSINDPGHTHSIPTQSTNLAVTNSGPNDDVGQGAGYNTSSSTTGITINSNTTGITTNTNGNSLPHNNMQPTAFIGNYFIFGKINELYIQ